VQSEKRKVKSESAKRKRVLTPLWKLDIMQWNALPKYQYKLQIYCVGRSQQHARTCIPV